MPIYGYIFWNWRGQKKFWIFWHSLKSWHLTVQQTANLLHIQQGSQLASCRAVSCVGFHVVSWIPHGVHVETIWCQHLKLQGVYIWNHMVSIWKPWKWHRDKRATMKLVVFRLISSCNWGNIWKLCGFHLEVTLFPPIEMMWKWCFFHLVVSHHGNDISICGNHVETTNMM